METSQQSQQSKSQQKIARNLLRRSANIELLNIERRERHEQKLAGIQTIQELVPSDGTVPLVELITFPNETYNVDPLHLTRFITEFEGLYTEKTLLHILYKYFIRFSDVEDFRKRYQCTGDHGCKCGGRDGPDASYYKDSCIFALDDDCNSNFCDGSCYCPRLRRCTCYFARKDMRQKYSHVKYRRQLAEVGFLMKHNP
jgi:hypothetical protein